MTDMRAAALSYWDRGWVPLPLRSEGSVEDRKKPAVDAWRKWQYIRPERELVERWWTEMPQANIALICGRVSGLVVIDFDAGEHHGIDPIEFLVSSDLPRNVGIVETGKGWHVYFKHPGGHIPNGVRVGRLQGVPMDVRGDGGYVVAPPSIHGSGRQYAWLQDPGEETAVLPDAVRRAIDGSPDNDRADLQPVTADDYIKQATELDGLLRGAGQGERNHSAARVAGYFLKVTHRDLAAAWSLLKIWNTQNQPPLPERELHEVFQHIERADAESALDELIEAQDDEHLMVGQEWANSVRDAPPRTGIPAPSLPTLEEVGGLVPKDLIILAGRPGMGKSTIAWGIAYDAALRQRLPTVLFSTEMTSVDVARWMASRIHGEAVSRLTREQWLATLDLISRSPITICDRGSVAIDYIERVIENRPETKLVIIDHIQRVSTKGLDGDSRNGQLEQLTVRLKNLAKDHNCTVIILSQMNRQGALSRPSLAALRDSGGLEQEADAVFFVWSDVDDPTRNPLPVKVLIAKNRHGALREVDCLFFKHLHRFEAVDMAQRMLQHAADAKATQTLNAIMRGEDPSEQRTPAEPAPRPVGDPVSAERDEDPEDTALRLLD